MPYGGGQTYLFLAAVPVPLAFPHPFWCVSGTHCENVPLLPQQCSVSQLSPSFAILSSPLGLLPRSDPSTGWVRPADHYFHHHFRRRPPSLHPLEYLRECPECELAELFAVGSIASMLKMCVKLVNWMNEVEQSWNSTKYLMSTNLVVWISV